MRTEIKETHLQRWPIFGLLPKRNQGKFSKIGRLLGRTSKVWKCRIYLSNYRLIVWIDSVTILVFAYTKTVWNEIYCRNPFNESSFCISRCNKIFIYRFLFQLFQYFLFSFFLACHWYKRFILLAFKLFNILWEDPESFFPSEKTLRDVIYVITSSHGLFEDELSLI